jgi:hypothetical protein
VCAQLGEWIQEAGNSERQDRNLGSCVVDADSAGRDECAECQEFMASQIASARPDLQNGGGPQASANSPLLTNIHTLPLAMKHS